MQGSALDWAQWGGGGLGGGLGSVIGGGNFFDGVRQGLITGGLNHAAHSLTRPNDIIYLLDKEGAGGFGHTAMLIQNPNGTWTFISKAGSIDLWDNATVDIGPRTYTSPEDFYSSGEGQRYESRVRYNTSSGQDEAAMSAMLKSAYTPYRFFRNNCNHACNAALGAAGLPTSSTILPSKAHWEASFTKSLMNQNKYFP